MAERQGFEPWVRDNRTLISNHAPSATRLWRAHEKRRGRGVNACHAVAAQNQ